MAYCGYIFHAGGRVEEFLNIDLRRAAGKVLRSPSTLLIFDGDGTILGQGRHLKPAGETAEGFDGGDKVSAYAIVRTELGSQIIADKVYVAMLKSCSEKLLALLAQQTKGSTLAKFM